METLESVAAVLAQFPIVTGRILPLGGGGGFSGAAFWRVETAGETLCLRRWPTEHPSTSRLRYIHDVLRHVFDRGVTQIALPRRTRSGATFVEHDGYLWEVSPWMPGTADYHRRPSREKLADAMRLLARFHIAAATFDNSRKDLQTSPGIRQRLKLTEQLTEYEASRIAAALESDANAPRKRRASMVLQAFLDQAPRMRQVLAAATRRDVPLQPCLRDVWHDHVLFSGNQVTGLVDFGALNEECVSADVARLLGSLVRADPYAWQFGLQTYQHGRPMSENESAVLDVFGETNAVLSGMNWLRWIYLERRQFDDSDRVLARLDENLENAGRIHNFNRG